MKVAYVSLGCPKNLVDLETILGGLQDVEIIDDPGEADATIVNTCAFITSAKQESIDAIFDLVRIKQSNPEHKILVAGCLPQRYREELAAEIPEVDAFFNSTDVLATTAEIRHFLKKNGSFQEKRKRITPSHFAYLRIAEGCDNRCSYCAIPLIKGSYKKRSFDEIIQEAHELVASGVRELILVAQDTTYFGWKIKSGKSLSDLLTALNEIKDLRWIRLMYTHPAHWDERLMETIADLDKVVKYVDLPIQHASDRLLRKMGRKVTRAEIELLIHRLRSRIPALALRTSLIVGFPGESEEEFGEIVQFVTNTRFERLGVFTYSHEEETEAFSLGDDVSEEEKESRQQEIMEVQAGIAAEQNRALLGKKLEVLIDEVSQEENQSLGRTQWDAPEIDNNVIVPRLLPVGRFVQVNILGTDTYDLFGETAG